MHLRSLTILALLLISFSVKAQFHITPQVGMTFASIKQLGDNPLDQYSQDYDQINLGVGVMVSKQISSDFRLQAEVSYTQRGTQVDHSNRQYPFIDFKEINTKYLDVGMQIAYSCIDNLSFDAGLYYSFLLGGHLNYELDPSFLPEVVFKREYDNETGASLGLSYTLYNITARAKYSFGLWGTRENEKHHWFLLTLGYRFEV